MKLLEIRDVNYARMPGPGDPETAPDAWRQAGLIADRPARQPRSEPDPHAEQDIEDRFAAQRAAQARTKYNEKFVDEEGTSPSTGQHYNMALVIDAETMAIATKRLQTFYDLHWGAKVIVDQDLDVSDDPKRPVRLKAYILDRHKRGFEQA